MTLVRRALAVVCTVRVLLVLTDIVGYNRLKFSQIYPPNEFLGTPLGMLVRLLAYLCFSDAVREMSD